MFGDWGFQAKTAQILQEKHAYDFHKFERSQKRFFKRHCSHVKDMGGNEYDAAGSFMCQMITSINDPASHRATVQNWATEAVIMSSQYRLPQTQELVLAVQEALTKELS